MINRLSMAILAAMLCGCGDADTASQQALPLRIEAPNAPQEASALPPPPLPLALTGAQQ